MIVRRLGVTQTHSVQGRPPRDRTFRSPHSPSIVLVRGPLLTSCWRILPGLLGVERDPEAELTCKDCRRLSA